MTAGVGGEAGAAVDGMVVLSGLGSIDELLPSWAFVTAALVLAATPGPGMAYVVARTIAGGRGQGLASCLGTAAGGLIHVAAAAIGLSWLVAHSALAFSLLKYAGAIVLVGLGIMMFRRAALLGGADAGDGRLPQPHEKETKALRGQRRAWLTAFCQGVAVEGLNVKTALFFLAFLPQFVSPLAPLAPQILVLGSLCVALNTVADVVAALLADQLLKASPGRQARERLMMRLSGGAMLALAASLAMVRRQS